MTELPRKMKKTTFPSNEEELDLQEIEEIEHDGHKLLCSFKLDKAKFYGIEVRESCGRLYALCPVCATQFSGWYEYLSDAIKCHSKSALRDIKKFEEEAITQNKDLSVLLQSTFLMKTKFAIISKTKQQAEAWIKLNGLNPESCLILESEKDVGKIGSKHQVVFIGKRLSYLSNPLMKSSKLLKELERQENLREYAYYVVYTDDGSQSNNRVKPHTLIVPVDTEEQLEVVLSAIKSRNTNQKNPTLRVLSKKEYDQNIISFLKDID